MRYLCLGYHDESIWAALPADERDELIRESATYEQQLRRGGHYIEGHALQPAPAAATLRFAGGKVAVTDGPFAETKEQLGGIMVLEATDLNHAIQLMSRIPCMRVGGSMEIRPLNEELTQELAGLMESMTGTV
jgi:hypothetical protein